ncbi:MAG: LysM peptidoglycan-binding domain-containing protein, partial [Oscillospiraceae bacterium]
EKVTFISDIALSDPAKRASNDYLVLYYSQPNESLWDIAKQYNSTSEKIKAVNKLQEDYSDGRMILIPKSCA